MSPWQSLSLAAGVGPDDALSDQLIVAHRVPTRRGAEGIVVESPRSSVRLAEDARGAHAGLPTARRHHLQAGPRGLRSAWRRGHRGKGPRVLGAFVRVPTVAAVGPGLRRPPLQPAARQVCLVLAPRPGLLGARRLRQRGVLLEHPQDLQQHPLAIDRDQLAIHAAHAHAEHVRGPTVQAVHDVRAVEHGAARLGLLAQKSQQGLPSQDVEVGGDLVDQDELRRPKQLHRDLHTAHHPVRHRSDRLRRVDLENLHEPEEAGSQRGHVATCSHKILHPPGRQLLEAQGPPRGQLGHLPLPLAAQQRHALVQLGVVVERPEAVDPHVALGEKASAAEDAE
mmetsp:Transcript_78988/g.229393  ORF Transcript_78988/g.229393 Transcript_78988/m.229393 type:complete len:338 (-) Transcript_78988:1017-2030(-)